MDGRVNPKYLYLKKFKILKCLSYYGSFRKYLLRKSNSKRKKNRKSHRRCSVKKVVLRNFAKITEKHLCQSLFFNKVEGLRSATLLKKRLWHRCFPVNFEKFLRTPFLQNTSRRLRLEEETFPNKIFCSSI